MLGFDTDAKATITYDSTKGTVTDVVSGDQVTATDGKVSVEATPADGYSFLGWVNTDTHERMKTEASASLDVPQDVNVTAVFVKNDGTDAAWFLVDSKYLTDNLNLACTLGTTVVLAASGTLSATADNPDTKNEVETVHIIPSGVTLLIPFSASDDGDFGPTPNNYISQEDIHATLEANNNDITKVCYAYRTLTVASGAVIECEGSINVNGQRQNDGQSFTGVVMGAHGKLILGTENTGAPEKNEGEPTAQLIIKPGGTLYAYGYITGRGMVQVDGPSDTVAGGTVHEIFQMASWPGGSKAVSWKSTADDATNEVLFVISEYYVQNIEAPLKVNYGATHKIEAAFSISGGDMSRSVPFITTDTATEAGLFLLGENAYVLRIYDVAQDRMNYYLKGGDAKIGSISLEVKNSLTTVTIDSANYILPITHNMTLIIDGATATLDKKTALLPGAELIIEDGSTLTLTEQLYIFDVASYTSSHFFNRAGYSTTNTTPNHCPVPYVATRGGLSPKASGVVTFTFGDGTWSSPYTDSYYLNIENIKASAKLEVNGTLDISGNGAICASSGSNTDKVVDGTGTIKNLGTPAAPTILGGVTATSNITFGNGLGNIVGSGKLKAFADDTTYYGFYFDADDDGVEEYWWSTNEKSITLHCMADSTTEVKSWNIRLYDSFDLTAYHTDVACTTKATSSFTGSDLYYKAQAYIVRNSQNQYYELINDAISDSAADETVFVLDDVTLTAEISVPAGKDLVLDLNEKTVTYAGTVVTNAGTLSVINGTIVNTSTTAGYGISNSGTIELINDITIDSSYGGIYQSAGTITEIGGKDGNVTVNAAYYALYINGGTVGTIGGENATVSIIQETTDQGHTRCVTVQSGTINLIGGLNSNITIKQIFQSTTGKGVPYLFQVNGGKVNTIGGNGAVIKLIQNSNSSQDGYGLIMSSGSVGTIGGSNVKAVEVIARDYPLYLSGGTLSARPVVCSH